MGLRDALRRLRGTEEQRTIDVLWDVGGSLRPASVTVDQALGLVPVFAAVRLLASQVASLPLQTYRKAGDTRQKINPWPLFVHPSVQGTLYDWLHRCMTSLALRGNAFGYITQRDRDQYPTMIEWLHPDDVRVDDRMPSGPGSYTNPVWYWQGRVIPAEDLLHIPWFTVPGRVLGLSPIGACAATISTGLSAQVYTSDWFASGAVPPGEFKNTAKTVTQTEADIISARLNAAIKRRKPLIYGNDWEYKPISVSAHEAKFIETMRMNATQIASIYGIPPEMIGGEAGGPLTYNTVESNAAGLEKFTLRPWLTLLEAAFFALMPRPQYVKFNVDSLLRTDLQTRIASYQVGRNIGLYNIDEARAIEDLPPLPNGEGQDYTPLQILTSRSGQPQTVTRYLPRQASTVGVDYLDAEVIDERHMKGLHNQKDHGRPGVKGALKKAVKGIADAVSDGPGRKSGGKLKPKKDMTFRKFRDFQNAMEAREIHLSGHDLYPGDEQLPPDAYKSRTIQAKYLAPPIAERWQVDRADLEELAAENMRVPQASLKGVPTEQLKRDFVEHALIRHGGGGGSTTVAQAAAVADHLGLPYEPTETDVKTLAYIKARPGMDRALTSLGIAQYEHTQAWLKDHGITEVTLARGMSRADGDREGLPYTSWASSYGGVLGTELGFSNLDFNDPEVQQKIYDAERPVRVTTIPAELILSTGLTGFGTLNESEAVVLPLPKAPDADADPLTAKYKSIRPSGEDLGPPSFDDDEFDDEPDDDRYRSDAGPKGELGAAVLADLHARREDPADPAAMAVDLPDWDPDVPDPDRVQVDWDGPTASADDLDDTRAVTPDGLKGGARLKWYWTKGPGLAKWATKAHKWTALYHHLLKYMPPGKAKRTAAAWFHSALGYWPGQAGKNKVGPG